MSKKSVRSIVILIAMLIAAVSGYFKDAGPKLELPDGSGRISFVDVGQGDCTLAELPNGEVMLIDCGEYDYRDKVTDFLEERGICEIDYLIATHPHTDHMGAMSYIIDNFVIKNFYMPEHAATTKAFEDMITSLDNKSISPIYPKAGDVIFESESQKCEVLSPVLDTYDETNDYSIVLRLTIGEKSFLFMADAEHYAEEQITASVGADVIKIGHHGSSGSTSAEFLGRVSPRYAVISCGTDNSYGHPHKEIISLLADNCIEVYRTDISGTVTMLCDGKTIVISSHVEVE